ncbi:MAG TPA: chemotaxis protein CheW [Pyrinomonadaceae bacterium]|nr:chemotaxis protein CheW [Pyrinomonadaceae bacterium]
MNTAEPAVRATARDEAEPQLRDLLLFVAGDRTFGVFSDEVESTAEAKHPTPLPLAPSPVLGIVYVRGRMLTLLDPSALSFGEALAWPAAVPAIISLRGDEQLALAAGSFGETITIFSSDIEISSNDEETQTSKAVAGILRHGGEKITVLDVTQLFEAAVQRKERRRRRF